jgi:hypothetical protein
MLDANLRERRDGHEAQAPVIIEVLAEDFAGRVLDELQSVLGVPIIKFPVIGGEEVSPIVITEALDPVLSGVVLVKYNPKLPLEIF